jgi:hypothetical protein
VTDPPTDEAIERRDPPTGRPNLAAVRVIKTPPEFAALLHTPVVDEEAANGEISETTDRLVEPTSPRNKRVRRTSSWHSAE